MANGGLIETAAQIDRPDDRRLFGVSTAQVIANIDETNQGRVQVRLPWLPSIQPWVRVATLMTGDNRGTYFIPQEGDEVLVAFNQGDIGDAYIIGSLWNGRDRPPASAPTDAINIRKIRTRAGHEITFDDLAGSISITSSSQQKIVIDTQKIEIGTAGGKSTLRLETTGKISLQATVGIDLQAPKINISGQVLSVNGSETTKVGGGKLCAIQATQVTIN